MVCGGLHRAQVVLYTRLSRLAFVFVWMYLGGIVGIYACGTFPSAVKLRTTPGSAVLCVLISMDLPLLK